MPIEIEDMQTEVHVGPGSSPGGAADVGQPGSPAQNRREARTALDELVVEIVEDALDRMLREVD